MDNTRRNVDVRKGDRTCKSHKDKHGKHYDYHDLNAKLEDIQFQLQQQQQQQKQAQAQNDTDTISNVGNPIVNVNVSANQNQNPTTVKRPYANFWRRANYQLAVNDTIPFTFTGPTFGGITLLNPQTIRIQEGGDYFINYTVTVLVDDPVNETDVLTVIVNNLQMQNAVFGIRTVGADDVNNVLQITGTAIIPIPDNATLQLKNTGINEIDLFSLQSSVSASITLFKLD